MKEQADKQAKVLAVPKTVRRAANAVSYCSDPINRLTETIVFSWGGLDPETRLGEAAHFFLYDTVKIFLLLAVMIFSIESYAPGCLRSD